jgi:hypothetical protein
VIAIYIAEIEVGIGKIRFSENGALKGADGTLNASRLMLQKSK